ncbi:MAG: PucR family transcriptional regulator [Lachnospiraceae bacterium]|uniref:PucR family transcriptional regulator n=1 Tax=Parablautia sp. Marseille-Q6255 TaxID=3039593 RepID=UPI0024BD57CD|nr:helix-turn-helix domain-containing protein [Parablautia sp. Marseille-Q6255]
MKLSLSIIIEKLKEKGITVENRQQSEGLIQGAVYPYDKKQFEIQDISLNIWVFDKRNEELLDILIENGLKAGYCYIFCGAEMSKSEMVIQMISSIMDEFSFWKEQILLKMLEREDIQSIIDLMATKVRNPFSLMDGNGFILVRSKGYETIPKGTIWDTMNGNYLNIYDFYSPKEWKKIRSQMDLAGHRHVLFRPEKDSQHVYYAINLYDQNLVIGSIGALDNNGPFSKGQIAIMEMIRDMLELYFRTQYNAVESGTIITTAFNRLVNRDYDVNAIRKLLNKYHWKSEDIFYLIAFDFPDMAHSEMELSSFMNLIHMQFPKSVTGLYNKQIIIAVRKLDYDLDSKRQRETLQKFLLQYDFYCGVSYSFRGLENSQYFCEQSCYAASFAYQNEDSEEGNLRILKYKDVQVKHIINALGRKEEVRKYCHPAILMLKESRKKSDQVLPDCLKSFLANGRSIAHAAKALGMHRNTLIYRLDRLEEILDVRFEYLTDDELMGLLLSCYIAGEI